MAKSEFNPSMIEALKKNKSKAVFINDKGEWLFHETEGFEKYSSEEILGEASEEATEEKPKGKKAKKGEASEEANA